MHGLPTDEPFTQAGEREEHRFLVRLWRDRGSSSPVWRGSVYEVSSAAKIASDCLRDLWDFIMLRLQAAVNGAEDKEP